MTEQLPTGWAWARLGDIAETRLGKMLSAKAKTGAGPMPYLRNKNVQWGRIELSDIARMDFDEDEVDRFTVSPGDVLICEGGEVGRTAVWKGQLPWVGYQKALHRVRPAPSVSSEYLAYMMRWFASVQAFEPYVTGSTIKHLPQEDLRLLPVPVAPRREQLRIVAAIEEQFSRLDAAEASLLRVKSRLTHLQKAIYSHEIAGDWPVVPLRRLLREPLRNGHSAKASPDGFGIRTLTLTAVTKRDFSDANTKLTSADPARVQRLWLEPGDLLIERSNTPELVGTAALFRGPREWAIFPDLLIRVRVSNAVLPEFLEHFLRAEPARRYLRGAAQGIAGSMPKIDQGVIESLPVPLPSPDEQRDVVDRLDAQLSLVGAMNVAVDKALRRSAALRRSILERAFVGALVPQDAADEPASVLLREIAIGSVSGLRPKQRRGKVRA